YDEAFAHYQQGNDNQREILSRKGMAFDQAGHQRYIDRLIAFFSSEFFQRTRSCGSDTEVPIFVVGMPRSGTALVEQILASHPDIGGAGELVEITNIVESLAEATPPGLPFPDCLTNLNREAADQLSQRYLKHLLLRGGPAHRIVDKQPRNRFFL